MSTALMPGSLATAEPNRAELASLKARVDLVELFRGHGLEPKKTGKNWMLRCPFHADDTASLSINPEAQLWNCFACEAGGDAIRFLELKEGLEFGSAVKRLKEWAREPATENLAEPARNPDRLAGGFRRNDLLERVTEHYQKRFRESAVAQQYCNRRGLDSRELWEAFRIGYCDGTLLEMLPEEGPVRQAMTELGVLNARGKESFKGCLTVPLSHPDQGIVGLYGRRLEEGASIKHQYLPGPRRGVLNWQSLQTAPHALITESVLDALSFWRAGVPEVTCLYGVQGVPEGLESLLERYQVRSVTLALDGDRAGREATLKLSGRLAEHGLKCFRLELPDGQDPNQLLSERGPENLKEMLRRREPIQPEQPAETAQIETTADGFTARFGTVKYQMWPQPPFTNRLRARLRAVREHRMVMDVVDFYVNRSRKSMLNQLVAQLELPKLEAERHLVALLEQMEDWVNQRREQQREETSELPLAPELTAADREEALDLLRQPRLVERFLNDMEELGYVGEENAKLLGYLISVSRKLEKPLSGIILSQSGAGKSSLTELVESMTPPEDVVLFSRISPQALYWMARDGVKRKLLILEERVGGEGADYSIRVLQSRQKLTQAVVIKDPATGKLMTKVFVVEGPIAYLETTTDPRINHENATRCFEIVLDESPEQTRRIQSWQRAQRLPSRQDRRCQQERIRTRHHNAQRLLEPVLVFIPFAEHLTFPSRWLRTRRDNERFLCLVEASAFLHQYQRERGTTEDGTAYVMADLEDYRLAYRLAREVLTTTLHELSREARDLWELLREWLSREGAVEAQTFFTRREVRQVSGLEDHRLRHALHELVEMEYLEASNVGQGRTAHYRLVVGDEPKIPPSLRELTTPEELERIWRRR